MGTTTFALKGNICCSETPRRISIREHAYLVCENGLCTGIFDSLPEKYSRIPVRDTGDCLIIPGMTDLHIHAPQYSYRGTGMDLELLDWLNTITFPQEALYEDPSYAEKAYSIFAEDMKKSPTTRACIFATLHVPATRILMDLMEKTGLKTMVGKVNMDRNGSPQLQEASAEISAENTEAWIADTISRYENVSPILTPRFIPSCTDKLMRSLRNIQKKWKLPLQSHLSENYGEIAWVQELCPSSRFYGDAYDSFGLFGGGCPTVMAHCVHSQEEEINLILERGVYIAHCPQSNTNICSGIAPVRTYLDKGVRIGLGSDIAGGSSLSLFRAMTDAIQVSKLRWRLVDDSLAPVTFEEAFYMATEGGGSFFGKVGNFRPGYEFDALILDDSSLPHPQPLSCRDRLERLIYLADDRQIAGKYAAGKNIF